MLRNLAGLIDEERFYEDKAYTKWIELNIRRVYARIIPEPNSGCWIWMGSVMGGYGHCDFNHRGHPVHRLIYQLEGNIIPSGLHLHHTCRVKCCVNPDHLETITQSDHTAKHFNPEWRQSMKEKWAKFRQLEREGKI